MIYRGEKDRKTGDTEKKLEEKGGGKGENAEEKRDDS